VRKAKARVLMGTASGLMAMATIRERMIVLVFHRRQKR
jgi:hypothetical protein